MSAEYTCSMIQEKNIILDEPAILQKLKRIAFEIYENNFQESELVIAGISGTGYELAQLIYEDLKSISPFSLQLVQIQINKEAPLTSDIQIDCEVQSLSNKSLVIVDDVLNTGKTFVHSLKPFLKIEIKKIQTAVLVNRSHRTFPIATDYTGYELSTTIKQHIKVVLNANEKKVYLY